MPKKLTLESIDPRHLLVKVAEILEEFGVKYAVTGGMAVFVWGSPRFTADIDIVIQLHKEDIERLAFALEQLSKISYISKDAMHWALERRGEFNFIDGVSGIKVDFFVLSEGVFEREQLRRRIAREVLGKKVFFISPEDLVLSKLRWHQEGGSSRQLEDVKSVLKMEEKLDMQYIHKWAKTHSTLKILESLLKKN